MDRAGEELLHTLDAGEGRRPYTVRFARTPAEVREAQRLRWTVFAGEMGAKLDPREPGIDQDIFDAHCRHLVVRDESRGEVIGTYRVLAPEAARRIGCYYSESEFDLTRLRNLRAGMVEVGRSCIHPGHRGGAVIALLWSGLARYMLANRYAYLAGCASMGLGDGGRGVAAVWRALAAKSLAPVEYQVQPRRRLPLETIRDDASAAMPALIKGYLRCGAWVCGEPSLDPDFRTADFFMLLPLDRVSSRYARHFLGEGQAA